MTNYISLAADARLYATVEQLKKVREYRGLRLEEVSLGICSPDYLERVEKGNERPTMLVLHQLAAKFRLTVEAVLDWNPQHELPASPAREVNLLVEYEQIAHRD